MCYSILSPIFPLSLNFQFIIILLGILTVRCASIDTQLQGSYNACQPQLFFSGDLSYLLAPCSQLKISVLLLPASLMQNSESEKWPQGGETALVSWHPDFRQQAGLSIWIRMEESCCLVHYLFLTIGETQFVKGFETLLTGRKMKDLAQIH